MVNTYLLNLGQSKEFEECVMQLPSYDFEKIHAIDY